MKKLFWVKEFLENFAYSILGVVVLISLFILIVLSLPIFLYRWIVCQVLAPLCGRNLGKAVTIASSVTATEIHNERGRSQPRCAIIANITIKGTVTFEELRDVVQRNWISAEMSNGGGLKYPEFQQYVDSWMGYLFWKQDKSFNLGNHLMNHRCEDNWTDKECEQYACSIVEDLLNKPFPKGRSPWELHLISNFNNSESRSDRKESTVLSLRFHHSLADGFGSLSVFVEGFCGKPLSECYMAAASTPNSRSRETNFLQKLLNFSSLPIKVMWDLGYFVSVGMVPIRDFRTPWYIPESRRAGRQLFARSRKLPICKLKYVKDKFGVSFTATLLSSIAHGISSSFKSKGFPNHAKTLPFLSALPLKGHPNKLRNHTTGVYFELPIDQTLNSQDRLIESERQFQKAKQSTFPIMAPPLFKVFAAQLPFISKPLLTNRTLSTGLSNFPGPGIQLGCFSQGRDLIGLNFGAGLLYGTGGVGFMVMSYCDHIRISIVAENAALERHELEDLVKTICDEIDNLHELAKGENNIAIDVAENEQNSFLQ